MTSVTGVGRYAADDFNALVKYPAHDWVSSTGVLQHDMTNFYAYYSYGYVMTTTMTGTSRYFMSKYFTFPLSFLV